MMTYEEQVRAIAKAPPQQVIAKNQKGMSYLETFYVKLELNRIFGVTSVSMKELDLRVVQDELVTQPTHKDEKPKPPRREVEYIATVNLRVMFANGEIRLLQGTGGGTGYARTAHTDAAKEAESDALKRACTHLGPAFGATLYDKTNPLHNGGPCDWTGYQLNDHPGLKPQATPPPAAAPEPPPPEPTPEPDPTPEPHPGYNTHEWTDAQRKGFCASLNRLGIQYMDFAAFCESELETQRPSAWSEGDRSSAIADLAPGGRLRPRFLEWNANDKEQREQDRLDSIPPKVPKRPKKVQPTFDDDDIPF
ncbi:hypothetical protein [uncultured Mediterranean phage]|nr:hypothetical protein [uncultured Mediterranean phage]